MSGKQSATKKMSKLNPTINRQTGKREKTVDFVNEIIAYESGELTFDEVVDLFQRLIDTGVINHLQGSYQRTAYSLIEEGYIQCQVK